MAVVTLYTLTYNCGRAQVDKESFATIFLRSIDALPDLVFLSLQEIAPIHASFIGGSYIEPYLSNVQDAVKLATERAGGSYKPVAVRHIGMTALLAFARDVSRVESVETAGVGVGVIENMGNKGAAGVRFTYRQGSAATELTFVAAHLAASEDAVKRRNEDWMNIVRGLVFSSTNKDGLHSTSSAIQEEDEEPLLSVSPENAGLYKPTSHLFLAGDLNYRTSMVKPSPKDPEEAFPQIKVSPESPRYYGNFLQNDQLNKERLAGRTCHGLTEEPVTFPPTYKYTDAEPFLLPDEELSKWNWATHRWPSWCDRILYLKSPEWLKRQNSNADIVASNYSALPLMSTSDHRPVACYFEIPLTPIPSPSETDGKTTDPRVNKPYNIDPNWRSSRKRARRMELLVGIGAYMVTTWEGGTLAVATLLGLVGAILAFQAIVSS